jgi:hypothetical protein
MTMPFPETAAELLERARVAPSPIAEGSYGYFIARTGELFGNREVAERCKDAWLRLGLPRYEGGEGVEAVAGVSAWRSVQGELNVLVVARDDTTGRVAATRLGAFPD